MATRFDRTFGTATSRKIMTFSFWCKRAKILNSAYYFPIFHMAQSGIYTLLDFNDTYNLRVLDSNGTDLVTTRLFRDTSAWYHIVVSIDTTQATASNRIKMYVNGVQETLFGTATYPSLNADMSWNNNVLNSIGQHSSALDYYYDGLLASVYFIDGQALTQTSFGTTDATTGIWKPKSYSGSYGTNGFFLKFENSGSLGTDSSGNGNNFSIATGTPTQTIDTPSNVFATFNPLNVPTSNAPTFSEGNLQVTTTNLSHVGGFSTIGITTGKWYAEFKIISTSSENATIGITGQSAENARNNKFAGQETTSYGYSYTAWGSLYDGSGTGSWGSTYGAGDIIGVAVDLDSNNLYFYKNGVVQNGGTAVSITASSSTSEGVYCFGTGDGSIGNNNTVSANFGNGYFGTTAVASAQSPDDGIGIFEYEVPAGYKALCTKSINAQEYA